MSEPRYRRAVMIFRRDLRLEDNTALCAAARASAEIVPVFIFDPRQAGPHEYRSENAVRFMLASLAELAEEISARGGRLTYWRGEAEQEVPRILAATRAEAVFFNRDYTPFSHRRDEGIVKACTAAGVAVHAYDDALLHAPEEVLTTTGKPYTVYTAYFRAAARRPPRAPQALGAVRFVKDAVAGSIEGMPEEWHPAPNPQLRVKGGRREALGILASLASFKEYARTRDYPAQPTTALSAHIKFGTVSLREVHTAVSRALGQEHVLINELYWHDFFTQIAWHFPHVFGHAFHRAYDALQWHEDMAAFAAWCEGRTGFPIVDAGMRELNATGFMHNRVRMIVASFLVKDLWIDWRWGERYFAQRLVDYDPAVNNGNWQWAASTGCDAQPFFRIFNPWLQQKKFDPEARYITRWVPELAGLSAREIHDPRAVAARVRRGYPQPICEHGQASAAAKERFRRVREVGYE